MLFGVIKLSEHGRIRIAEILCCLYFLNLIISISLLVFGAHLKVSVSKLKHVYTGYDDDALPYMFIAVGVVSVITNILTGLACFASQHVDNRKNTIVGLRILGLVNFCVAVTMLAASIMSFVHTKHLGDAFDRGLRESMADYAYNPVTKTQLDTLQMDYKCCGNQGHEDWFKVGWILDKFNEPLADLKETHSTEMTFRQKRNTAPELEGSASTQDSVPFSCCDPTSHRPCVHRDITNKQKHLAYDYTGHTLHQKGCTEAIMEHLGGTLLTAGGIFALASFFIELVLMIITRYLQTSMAMAIDMGYFDVTAPGYLINLPWIVGNNKHDSALYQPFPNSGVNQESAYYDEQPEYYETTEGDYYDGESYYGGGGDDASGWPSDTFEDQSYGQSGYGYQSAYPSAYGDVPESSYYDPYGGAGYGSYGGDSYPGGGYSDWDADNYPESYGEAYGDGYYEGGGENYDEPYADYEDYDGLSQYSDPYAGGGYGDYGDYDGGYGDDYGEGMYDDDYDDYGGGGSEWDEGGESMYDDEDMYGDEGEEEGDYYGGGSGGYGYGDEGDYGDEYGDEEEEEDDY